MLSRNSINKTVQLYYGTLVHTPGHAGARIMHAHSRITHAHARILQAHARSDSLMHVHDPLMAAHTLSWQGLAELRACAGTLFN